jgi:TonB family protein
MNNVTQADALDRAIDAGVIMAGQSADGTRTMDAGLAPLLAIARELQGLPRPEFKSQLKVELEWEASGRAMSMQPAAAQSSSAAIMPSLFGNGGNLYPLRGTNVAASVALHASLLLLIAMGLFTVHRAPQILGTTIRTGGVRLSAYIPERGSGGGSKGGGGQHDRFDASRGVVPPAARMPLAPPVVQLQDHLPKLMVKASVLASPDLNVPRSGVFGDPLSNLMIPSGGPGIHGGIGRGDRGGVGSDSGPYVGTSGTGTGNGVSWPRAIYQPEPEFSDEARREHYQGLVSLLIVVGVDGRAHDIRTLRSLGLGLDEKAIEAVRTWRFEPGKKDGRPVPVEMEVDVDFRIH